MDVSVSFGYNELKVKQLKALKAFVERRDVFISLPTTAMENPYAVLCCLLYLTLTKNWLKKHTFVQ